MQTYTQTEPNPLCRRVFYTEMVVVRRERLLTNWIVYIKEEKSLFGCKGKGTWVNDVEVR